MMIVSPMFQPAPDGGGGARLTFLFDTRNTILSLSSQRGGHSGGAKSRRLSQDEMIFPEQAIGTEGPQSRFI
jgi:hypothetical protein